MFSRIANLFKGFLSLFVSGLERQNPKALIEAEKENLRAQIIALGGGLWENRPDVTTAYAVTDDEGGWQAELQIDLQAVDDFHRLDPMEVVATPEEVAQLVAGQAEKRLLIFPEKRTRPIRMFEALPLRWIEHPPTGHFTDTACRNEYYVFQLGLFAPETPVRQVTLAFSDLKTDCGQVIPSSALTCFNLEGTDWLGHRFAKQVDLTPRHVQPL